MAYFGKASDSIGIPRVKVAGSGPCARRDVAGGLAPLVFSFRSDEGNFTLPAGLSVDPATFGDYCMVNLGHKLGVVVSHLVRSSLWMVGSERNLS